MKKATPPATGAELRRAFVDFFAGRGHLPVPSSPLAPGDDPTLLFANAGMNQFKDFFLGQRKPEAPRAVSVQKCLRAGGKHNDLDNVGLTARHHTFFEMLGNFSFGDYFKEEAVALAWEFLTKEIGLPADRLSVSVFEGDADTPRDEEAERLWAAFVPKDRIAALPASENFWSMGDTGPCGPCSEIHFDQGPDFAGEDRHLEVWNLVFMQFDRSAEGALAPLPAPSVDTGMGLERLAAVVQGVASNYDTDLFRPLVESVRERAESSGAADGEAAVAARVFADHARSVLFLAAEGVRPGNEGRGYVLRKILRRAFRYGRRARVPGPFLAEVTDRAIGVLGDAWPELAADGAGARAREIVEAEAERFDGTLRGGMRELEEIIGRSADAGDRTISGEDAFRLYDTFGVPLDIISHLAETRDWSVDAAGFAVRLEEQRERARRARKSGTRAASPALRELSGRRRSEFIGYEATEEAALEVIGAFLPTGGDGEDGDVAPTPVLREGVEGELVLDRTPFYPEGGGQVGDVGFLRGPGGRARVLDTRSREGLIAHRVLVEEGEIAAGDRLEAGVDRARRRGAASHHTVTHLLHAALRQTLGLHVRQAGSLVAPDRLRFDFTHDAPLTAGEIESIEGVVNEQIRRNPDVLEHRDVPLDEALSRGALAFFGDRYGTNVRVIEVPDFSIELCGGTHLSATGAAGLFVIVSQESISAGVRRVEALTGAAALAHVSEARRLLGVIGRAAATRPEHVAAKLEKLRSDLKRSRKEVEKLRSRLSGPVEESNADESEEEIAGVLVSTPAPLDDVDKHEHRRVVDRFRDRNQGRSWVMASASVRNGAAAVILGVSPDIAERLPANALLRDAVASIGGRGGGRADRAEGGGPRPEGLGEMNRRVRELVRAAFSD